MANFVNKNSMKVPWAEDAKFGDEVTAQSRRLPYDRKRRRGNTSIVHVLRLIAQGPILLYLQNRQD